MAKNIRKSLKIKISFSTIWFVISLLLAGTAADGYSGFKFFTFLGTTIILSLPLLVYWLGFWIWGEGYLLKLFLWPFSFIFRSSPPKEQVLAVPKESTKENDLGWKFLLLDDPQNKHPWRRFWARCIDLLLASYLIGILNTLLSLTIFKLPDNSIAAGMIIFGWCAVIESLFLCLWGKSPGKWMLGITVRKKDGTYLSFSEAIGRSGQVWFHGMGLGIPIFNIYTMGKSRAKLVYDGITPWDKLYAAEVTTSKPSWFGVLTVVLLLISSLFLYGTTL